MLELLEQQQPQLLLGELGIDERKRQALYEDIQLKLWEDMPVLYLQQTKFIWLKKKNVTGLLGLKTQILHMTELAIA